MSKTSFILFFLLFIVLGIFLFTHFTPANNLLNPQNDSITNSPADQPATVLALKSKPPIGQTIEVDVIMESAPESPSIVQLEIGYDPNTLTYIGANGGNYFLQPKILLNRIIPRTGRITYAITCTEKSNCLNKNANTVATLTFAVASYARRETEVKILPKTIVRNAEDKELVVQAKSAKVHLFPQNVPSASSSAVIMQ